jgi:hypothetical protein
MDNVRNEEPLTIVSRGTIGQFMRMNRPRARLRDTCHEFDP